MSALGTALAMLVQGRDLDPSTMHGALGEVMNGTAEPLHIAAFLAALAAKGETVEEIAAAAEVLRRHALRLDVQHEHLVDTCGTGGDGTAIFNVSTAAAFVAAAGGAKVAKHGNRAVSSRSGSADVLEAAGVDLTADPATVAAAIETLGIGFLFAPAHHPATRYVVPVRRTLGVRTLFNLLGPLTNPAGAAKQLIGVYAERWLEPLAKTLAALGSRHVLVVHAEDGLDEISLASPTSVVELKDGEINRFSIAPEQFGIERRPLAGLAVAEPRESLALIEEALSGKPGAAFDIVALNAGAALYAADLTADLAAGIVLAREIQASGHAWHLVGELAEFTRARAGQTPAEAGG